MSTRPLFTTKEAVERWLNNNNIKSYKIAPDLSVKVSGNVELANKKLSFIPVNFSKVYGHFSVARNPLESLEGCPSYVAGNFNCERCGLYSLESGPTIVGSNYDAAFNNLVDLLGGPIEAPNLDISNNSITSLHNLPKKLERLSATYNQLTDFEGFDSHIKILVNISSNPISSWNGLTHDSLDPQGLILIAKTLLPEWKAVETPSGMLSYSLTGQKILPAIIASLEKQELESLLQNEPSHASTKTNKLLKI